MKKVFRWTFSFNSLGCHSRSFPLAPPGWMPPSVSSSILHPAYLSITSVHTLFFAQNYPLALPPAGFSLENLLPLPAWCAWTWQMLLPLGSFTLPRQSQSFSSLSLPSYRKCNGFGLCHQPRRPLNLPGSSLSLIQHSNFVKVHQIKLRLKT